MEIIHVPKGMNKYLCKICNASHVTVRRSLLGNLNTVKSDKIRKCALDNGGIVLSNFDIDILYELYEKQGYLVCILSYSDNGMPEFYIRKPLELKNENGVKYITVHSEMFPKHPKTIQIKAEEVLAFKIGYTVNCEKLFQYKYNPQNAEELKIFFARKKKILENLITILCQY